MTREHISSFVGDLVAMAKAMEELPQVQEQLADARSTIEAQAATIQRLELKLMERANELQAKLSDIRTLEVARDDAELRFLEADERTASALAFVRTVFGNAGALIQALDPPKVEAKQEPQSPLDVHSDTDIHSEQSSTSSASVQGQSEPVVSVQTDPIAATVATGSDLDVSGSHVTTSNDAFTPNQPGPYTNKRYIDHPGWVSREDWLAGGGTDESYDWREGHDAA